MSKCRVLLLVNRWYSDGGVENFLEQLVAETSDIVDYTICSLLTSVNSVVSCDKIGPVLSSGRLQDMFIHGDIIESMMRSGGYSVVHVQASNGGAFYLTNLARRARVPRRIVHSHNAGAESAANPLKKGVGTVSSFIWSSAPTDLWACSSNAGKYLFGNKEYKVFYNGINLERFTFSNEKRERIRRELGVDENVFLLGSIGRVSLQKNPLFQLRVFSKLRELIPSARFCMVGRGDLEQERDAEIEKLNLNESVIVVPHTQESDAFYCAFDALVFPPIFEGLSFVGIESQCCGLPVYASTAIPSELNVTDRLIRLSLEESPSVWAARIEEGSKLFKIADRVSYAGKMRNAGFDKASCFRQIALSYSLPAIRG